MKRDEKAIEREVDEAFRKDPEGTAALLRKAIFGFDEGAVEKRLRRISRVRIQELEGELDAAQRRIEELEAKLEEISGSEPPKLPKLKLG